MYGYLKPGATGFYGIPWQSCQGTTDKNNGALFMEMEPCLLQQNQKVKLLVSLNVQKMIPDPLRSRLHCWPHGFSTSQPVGLPEEKGHPTLSWSDSTPWFTSLNLFIHYRKVLSVAFEYPAAYDRIWEKCLGSRPKRARWLFTWSRKLKCKN